MEKGEGAGRQQPLATRAGRVRGQSGRPQLGATRGYAHPWQRQRWPRQGKAAVGRCGKRAAGDASAVAHAASRDATRRDLRREGGARPGPGTRALRTAEWRALLAVLPPWLLVVAGDSKGGASTATILGQSRLLSPPVDLMWHGSKSQVHVSARIGFKFLRTETLMTRAPDIFSSVAACCVCDLHRPGATVNRPGRDAAHRGAFRAKGRGGPGALFMAASSDPMGRAAQTVLQVQSAPTRPHRLTPPRSAVAKGVDFSRFDCFSISKGPAPRGSRPIARRPALRSGVRPPPAIRVAI